MSRPRISAIAEGDLEFMNNAQHKLAVACSNPSAGLLNQDTIQDIFLELITRCGDDEFPQSDANRKKQLEYTKLLLVGRKGEAHPLLMACYHQNYDAIFSLLAEIKRVGDPDLNNFLLDNLLDSKVGNIENNEIIFEKTPDNALFYALHNSSCLYVLLNAVSGLFTSNEQNNESDEFPAIVADAKCRQYLQEHLAIYDLTNLNPNVKEILTEFFKSIAPPPLDPRIEFLYRLKAEREKEMQEFPPLPKPAEPLEHSEIIEAESRKRESQAEKETPKREETPEKPQTKSKKKKSKKPEPLPPLSEADETEKIREEVRSDAIAAQAADMKAQEKSKERAQARVDNSLPLLSEVVKDLKELGLTPKPTPGKKKSGEPEIKLPTPAKPAAAAAAAAKAAPDTISKKDQAQIYQTTIDQFVARFTPMLLVPLREKIYYTGKQEKTLNIDNAYSRLIGHLCDINSFNYLTEETANFPNPLIAEAIWHFLFFNLKKPESHKLQEYNFATALKNGRVSKSQELAIYFITFAIKGIPIPIYLQNQINENGGLQVIRASVPNQKMAEIIPDSEAKSRFHLQFGEKKSRTTLKYLIDSGANFEAFEEFFSSQNSDRNSLEGIELCVLANHPDATKIKNLICEKIPNPHKSAEFEFYFLLEIIFNCNQKAIDENKDTLLDLLKNGVQRGQPYSNICEILKTVGFEQQKLLLPFYYNILRTDKTFHFNSDSTLESHKRTNEQARIYDFFLHLKDAAAACPAGFIDYLEITVAKYTNAKTKNSNETDFQKLLKFKDSNQQGLIDLVHETCEENMPKLAAIYEKNGLKEYFEQQYKIPAKDTTLRDGTHRTLVARDKNGSKTN